MSRSPTAGNRGQGSHWCHDRKRAAVYARDGKRCVWCDQAAQLGEALTLDHVIPRSKGGTNDPQNLITACMGCNRARGDLDAHEFAEDAAGRTRPLGSHADDALVILQRVLRAVCSPLPKVP